MSEHPHLALMRRTLEAFRSEDMPALAGLLSDDVAWPVPGEDRVTAERDGRRLDVRLLLHVTVRDGRIVEDRDYFHPEHLWDAFWG